MSLSQYFYDHYIMLTELIGLTALLGTGVHLPEKTKKATRIAILLIIIESVMWSFEQWMQDQSAAYVLPRALLSSCVYCMHPIIVTAIIEMTAPVRKYRLWLLIPLCIYIPVVMTSQWTHVIFHISESNHWRGNGHFALIPYIVFFCYSIAFMVLFIHKYLKYNLHTMAGVLYIIAVSFLGILVTKVRDTAADYATLFSSVIVLYYLFMYQHVSSIDIPTGMMNRQAFYRDAKAGRKKITAICSVDMNELKWINDSRGHAAGDAAIRDVAECLLLGTGPLKHGYRVGGDEFIILYFDKTEEFVKEDIKAMRDALSKTRYVCAFGYCMVDKDSDFDALLREADKAMYADKAAIKQAILAAGGKLHRRAGDR